MEKKIEAVEALAETRRGSQRLMMAGKSTFGFGGWCLYGEAMGVCRSVLNFARGWEM